MYVAEDVEKRSVVGDSWDCLDESFQHVNLASQDTKLSSQEIQPSCWDRHPRPIQHFCTFQQVKLVQRFSETGRLDPHIVGKMVPRSYDMLHCHAMCMVAHLLTPQV